jgi:hypothetical protein
MTSQTFSPEPGRTLNDFLKRPETWNRGKDRLARTQAGSRGRT